MRLDSPPAMASIAPESSRSYNQDVVLVFEEVEGSGMIVCFTNDIPDSSRVKSQFAEFQKSATDIYQLGAM